MTGEAQRQVEQGSSRKKVLEQMLIETLESTGDLGYLPYHFLRGFKCGIRLFHKTSEMLRRKKQIGEWTEFPERYPELQDITERGFRNEEKDQLSFAYGAWTSLLVQSGAYSFITYQGYPEILAIPLATNLYITCKEAYIRNKRKLTKNSANSISS